MRTYEGLGHQVQRFGLDMSFDSARTRVGKDGEQMKLELTQTQGPDQDETNPLTVENFV